MESSGQGGEPYRFDNRVVVVTGAGGGLGRAHALLLAARGAKVVVNDLGASIAGEGRQATPAEQVVNEITAAGGTAVANFESVEEGGRIVQCALDCFGRIDVVVNNAGMLRDRAFHNMTDEEWTLVLNVHLTGAYAVTRAAWPHLRAQRYGRVVFTTSAAGLFGNFGQANYGAAKLGLVGLCRGLAVEGAGVGVRVNAVSPSAASRMSGTMAADAVAMAAMEPELVSPLVAWLCHEKCQANGQVFAAGGGWVGALRWQQSVGARIGPSDIEAVARQWDRITDFGQATAPADIADGLAPVVDGHPKLQALFRKAP